MTAAKVMDVIARLPGCDGQATDAVSAYTKVKLEDAPRLLKIPKQKVEMFGYVFHDTNGQNHGQTLKIPWYIAVGKTIRRSFIRTWMEKIPNWACMFVHRKQWLFLSENVDDINMAGKTQNMALMWKKLMKYVDIDEPSSFLDHVYLGLYSA